MEGDVDGGLGGGVDVAADGFGLSEAIEFEVDFDSERAAETHHPRGVNTCHGDVHGASLADGFWSVVVGAAAQRSIETGAVVEIDDILPAEFDVAELVPNQG